MKSARNHWLSAASLLLIVASVMAQPPADDDPAAEPVTAKKKAAAPDEPRDLSYLADPLDEIRSNILDLERSGYFVIEASDFRTRFNGDEAIVWTVRMKKAVTCRHLEAMLREYRDVRFYSTIDERKLEVIATLMHYSERISLGSTSNRLLGKDDVFELWINMPTTYQQKLISLRADTLVLRRWKY